MKRLTVVLTAALLLLCAVTASAEGVLVKGGVTSWNVADNGNKAFSQKYTGWHAGIGYQTASVGGFSFQPELLFNVKGAKINDDLKWKMSYLELPINIQWGIDLLVARPFIYASPYLGYCISNKPVTSLPVPAEFENLFKNAKRFEYGIGIGAGINLWKLQIAGKYSWNFGPVADIKNFTEKIKNLKNTTGGYEISVALIF